METQAATKVCSRCGRELPISEFYKNPQCTDGHIGQCKRCKYEVAKERRNRNKTALQIAPPMRKILSLQTNRRVSFKTICAN